MIAYDPTGSLLVLADGAELLVHDGPSEGPLWRRMGESPLVAVGATPDAVIAVDAAGRATWSEHRRDHLRAAADAGVPVHAAAVAANGDLLVATPDGALVLRPTGKGPAIAFPGARAVAWGDGGRMLVAGADGKAGEYDARGQRLHMVEVDAPLVAAAWNPQGFWIVATAKKYLRVVDGAVHHLTSAPDDRPVQGLACSLDGATIALLMGDSLMIAITWPSRDSVAQLRYIDRTLTGAAFGPGPWLAIAMNGGDGNKINLATGDLHRTDTHPGRPHRHWLVSVSVNPPSAKPAPAPALRPAPAPERPAYAPPAEPPAQAQASFGTIFITLGVTLAVILGIAFLIR